MKPLTLEETRLKEEMKKIKIFTDDIEQEAIN